MYGGMNEESMFENFPNKTRYLLKQKMEKTIGNISNMNKHSIIVPE